MTASVIREVVLVTTTNPPPEPFIVNSHADERRTTVHERNCLD